MIDYVRLVKNVKIPESCLNREVWHEVLTDDGTPMHWMQKNKVRIRYYPKTQRMTIAGKLIRLVTATDVQNVDDIFGRDLSAFVEEVNQRIRLLLGGLRIDIREFSVTRLDYCFNVKTEYVAEYLEFLNAAFSVTNRKMRKNYAEEANVKGSVYIKTNADYRDDSRRNYVLNIYDKMDWIRKQEAKGQRFSAKDIKAAEQVLRVEVQCGDRFLASFCKKNTIPQTFGSLLDSDLALKAEEQVFKTVFHCDPMLDFYTYQAAKEKVPQTPVVLQTLKAAGTKHNIAGTRYAYARKQIEQVGVYPYCFLAKGGGISKLENPMKLLRKKVEKLV